MTDLVERLRKWNDGIWLEDGPNLLHEAADEIERLRTEIPKLFAESERLRQNYKQLEALVAKIRHDLGLDAEPSS